jgi:hypothetical protein
VDAPKYSFGTAVAGSVGSDYKLCWAHDPTQLSDFKVELDASGRMAGPIPDDLACTLGLSCGITVSGHHLTSTNDVVVISAGSCGDASPTVAVWTALGAASVDAQQAVMAGGEGTYSYSLAPGAGGDAVFGDASGQACAATQYSTLSAVEVAIN